MLTEYQELWLEAYSNLERLSKKYLTGTGKLSAMADYVAVKIQTERARHAAACDDVARGCLCGEGDNAN